MGILSHIFGLGLQKWIRDANPAPEVIGELLTQDDRWVTLKSGEEEEGEKARGRRVLLGGGGKIKGGNVPKEAQGMNVQEWGEKAGKIMGTEGGGEKGNTGSEKAKEPLELPAEPEAKPEAEILTSEPFESKVSPKGESHAALGNGRGVPSYSTTEDEIRDAEKSFSQALGRPVEQILRVPTGEPTESHQRAEEFARSQGIKHFVHFDTDDPQMAFVGGMMDHNAGTLYMNAGPHIPQEGETAHEVTHFIARGNPKLYRRFTKELEPHVKGYKLYKDSLNKTRAGHGLAPLPDKWMKEEYFASIVGELHAPGSPWPDEQFKPGDFIADFDKAKSCADKLFADNARNLGRLGGSAQKSAREGKSKTFIIDDNQDLMLREALDELGTAEKQGKTRIEGIGVRNYGSTYPKWFKDNRFSSATVLPVIQKALSGAKLIPSQLVTLKIILDAKETQWDQQYGDLWRTSYSDEPPFSLHSIGRAAA